MKKRHFWLKLFQESDTALACAIHLCERFVDEKQLQNGQDFIQQKIAELDDEVPQEQVAKVFGITPTEKVCSVCGQKTVYEHPDIPGLFMNNSDDIPGWPVCMSCMEEHCCTTNCLKCEYGKFPDCRFLDMKKNLIGGSIK